MAIPRDALAFLFGAWSCQPVAGKSRCPSGEIYYPGVIDRSDLPG
jgi:hypothetical protein